MMEYRWTVRLPQRSPILDMLHEVKETSGIPLGSLIEMAIVEWYQALPAEDDDEHVAGESCNHHQQRAART